MSPDDFVALFARDVYRAGIEQTISSLRGPAGRRPASDLVQAGEWYRGLDESQRKTADVVVVLAAHAVAFGALALIDGARSGSERFELAAIGRDGGRSVVNPASGDLHDLFQGLVMGPDGSLLT